MAENITYDKEFIRNVVLANLTSSQNDMDSFKNLPTDFLITDVYPGQTHKRYGTDGRCKGISIKLGHINSISDINLTDMAFSLIQFATPEFGRWFFMIRNKILFLYCSMNEYVSAEDNYLHNIESLRDSLLEAATGSCTKFITCMTAFVSDNNQYILRNNDGHINLDKFNPKNCQNNQDVYSIIGDTGGVIDEMILHQDIEKLKQYSLCRYLFAIVVYITCQIICFTKYVVFLSAKYVYVFIRFLYSILTVLFVFFMLYYILLVLRTGDYSVKTFLGGSPIFLYNFTWYFQ